MIEMNIFQLVCLGVYKRRKKKYICYHSYYFICALKSKSRNFPKLKMEMNRSFNF